MSIARTLLLKASKSPWLAERLSHRRFVHRAVRRFMPGEDVASALEAAQAFARARIGTVLTELGENVTSLADAQRERDRYLEVLGRIADASLPTHLSVKLTHLGLDVDREACARAVEELASRAGATGSFLWIDMEDSSYTDATLDLYERVRRTRPSTGLCLQAYLRRTPGDLERLLPLAPAIRLVKGAYAESATLAFPKKRDVDDAYLSLAERLLAAAARGRARPVFGTHDFRLVGLIRERAASLRVARGAYEFHLLYGIRAAEQTALAAAGESVRVLVSYGAAWFAWYMRRLAERPANVWFVLKNLL